MVSSLYCSVTKLSNMRQPLDCAQILWVRNLDRTQWEQLVSAQLGRLSRLLVAQWLGPLTEDLSLTWAGTAQPQRLLARASHLGCPCHLGFLTAWQLLSGETACMEAQDSKCKGRHQPTRHCTAFYDSALKVKQQSLPHILCWNSHSPVGFKEKGQSVHLSMGRLSRACGMGYHWGHLWKV